MNLAIIGGTGYTGQELLRLLVHHPHINLAMVCSRSQHGECISHHLPYLKGLLDVPFARVDMTQLAAMDMVVSATPNGVAMQQIPALLQAGVRVLDLAADFRLRDPAVWQATYAMPHACSALLDQAVYGLAEWHRDALPEAKLVANPGCYATAMQLALLPFMSHGDSLDLEHIHVDGKSGVSGAGKGANVAMLFAQIDSNLSPYAVTGHRHTPEVLQQLRLHNSKVGLVFVPHLIPMVRGMLTTAYIPVTRRGFDAASASAILRQTYQDCRFVQVMQPNEVPQTKSVSGTNNCHISATVQGETLILCSVIDNLGKGAAGQAVQNINLMHGWDETLGLRSVALYP